MALIRDKLIKIKIGTCRTQAKRQGTRQRKESSKVIYNRSASPGITAGSSIALSGVQHHFQLRVENNHCSSTSLDNDAYYYWMDYKVKVEIRNGMLSYVLNIKNVDESFVGDVNVAPYVEGSG
jgi:hypothetical protein